MSRRALLACAFFFIVASLGAPPIPSRADSDPPLLLRDPTVSRTQIAFAYAGYIWIVSRAGGPARRLVTGYDLASGPHFSPDGSTIAFTANYDGNLDVYVVPSAGGQPRRLTYHGNDAAVGWTPDGTRVLFVSNRDSSSDPDHLYTIPVRGGAVPTQLPLSMAEYGSYSPDGTHLAYVPNFQLSRSGRAIAAAKRRPSGSQISPIPASSKCRVKTLTTTIRCGLAIRSTSSPIATDR